MKIKIHPFSDLFISEKLETFRSQRVLKEQGKHHPSGRILSTDRKVLTSLEQGKRRSPWWL
jgi:hypothetical protein